MRVCVVGLGKLGAPLAGFLSTRHEVTGIDCNTKAVELVNQGDPPVSEPGLDKLMNFDASTDYAVAAEAEIIFIVVPTPSNEDGGFSLEYVTEAIAGLQPFLTPQHLVVLVSTVMPGDTETLVHIIPYCGLCYNPSFIALGTVIENLKHPDLLLVGCRDFDDGERLARFWLSMVSMVVPVRVMDYRSAEISKLALNCFVTMKISFANTLGELCEEWRADADLVTGAIGLDRRVGNHYLKPALAYGGPCFPRDSKAFIKAAGAVGVEPYLARATDRVNQWQHLRLRNKVLEALEALRLERPGTVAVLGIAYKVGTAVTEESAGLALGELLREQGARVLIHDPAVYDADGDPQRCIELADVVVITTPWPEYRELDYGGKIVIDPWGLLK